ncbi:hypothetical protein AAKU67_000452 [Oxalobacteraceae bacterium GrIS 2.11]
MEESPYPDISIFYQHGTEPVGFDTEEFSRKVTRCFCSLGEGPRGISLAADVDPVQLIR